jgi:chorismate mutase
MNPDRPFVIAGPCSAENEEQVIATAIGLKEIGIQVFRAGLWKPRTKPGSFEGVGNAGLQWLSRVKRETGLLTCVEVANSSHVNDLDWCKNERKSFCRSGDCRYAERL